jgi:hypothetical protein
MWHQQIFHLPPLFGASKYQRAVPAGQNSETTSINPGSLNCSLNELDMTDATKRSGSRFGRWGFGCCAMTKRKPWMKGAGMNHSIETESGQRDTVTFVLKSKQPKTDPCGVSRVSQPPAGNLPRIAKLMALAIRFDTLVSRGEVQNSEDLARLGYVTRARITQIMNLLNLAPDIQEALLFLPRTTSGRDMFREKELRSIAHRSEP